MRDMEFRSDNCCQWKGLIFERQSGSLADCSEDHFRQIDGMVDHR